ncbi:MAG: TIGR03936 family radical SAM-associated protein, partial [Actinobacteria bacterium]|nr:TIGR03936 family radical SAM-associated protein [Actinomycetota bacterium]
LSHLDIVRLMTRALSRSGIIVKYDKGFNPKPKISFSNPIPLGVESLAEYCDLYWKMIPAQMILPVGSTCSCPNK